MLLINQRQSFLNINNWAHLKAYQVYLKPLLAIVLMFCIMHSGSVFADIADGGDATSDALSGFGDQMKATFGAGTTFIHILYGLEVVSAGYAYYRSKNIAILCGIVVLALFTNFALNSWVFPK